MRSLKVIDLFCGAGGSSWGARKAGAQIIAGFDKWDIAKQVYTDNFPEARFYGDDIGELDPELVHAELGDVDLIIASPECTNHSPAKGGGLRCEISKRTAFQVTRFAAVFLPRWILIENVVSMRRWGSYFEFLRQLAELGYKIKEQILDASLFRTPQKRRRLFIFCDREADPPDILSNPRWHLRSAKSVIRRNAGYQLRPLRSPGRAMPTLIRADKAIAKLGPTADFLIVYYGSDKGGGWQSLDRPLRTVTTLDRFAFVRCNNHVHEMRMLQVPELKRAMGMPNKFRIDHGTRREKIKLIGNAVCPLVMESAVRTLTKNNSKAAPIKRVAARAEVVAL